MYKILAVTALGSMLDTGRGGVPVETPEGGSAGWRGAGRGRSGMVPIRQHEPCLRGQERKEEGQDHHGQSLILNPDQPRRSG